MTKIKQHFSDDDLLSKEQIVALSADMVQSQLLAAPSAVSAMGTHLADSMGKGIRTLVMASCAADAQGNSPYSVVKAASAIELLHMATLVHDDIIDDAPTRRGKPSVQSIFGKKQAVLGGDWLLCCAMNAAVSIQVPEELQKSSLDMVPAFTRAVEKVCLGELRQGEQNGNFALSAPQYLRIVSQKTAALFYLAAYAGAVLGKCSEAETKILLRYALYLGLVFQIVDDIKDYTLEEQDTLKPVKNDLISGVITLPLILSFAQEPALRPMAMEVMRSGQGVQEFSRKVQAAGGIEQTREVADRYAQKARALLDKLPHAYKREQLWALMERTLQASKVF